MRLYCEKKRGGKILGQNGSEVIKSPFYLRYDGRTCNLTCEGLPPGTSIKSHFENEKAMRGQIRKYCAGDYQLRPWARLLFKGKYGE